MSESPAFICAACRKGSSHPEDGRHGFCELCRRWSVDERDLRIEVHRDSGVVYSMSDASRFPIVVIRHLPTGLEAECGSDASVLTNRENALAALLQLLATRLT